MKKNSGDKIHETDLYEPIRNFLLKQGFSVKSEVKHCDITAVKGDELVIIELKCSMNLELIMQAALRQRMSDLVYVAVPKPKGGMRSSRWRRINHLLKRLELGLITVSFARNGIEVKVVFQPSPFNGEKGRKVDKSKKKGLMNEFDGRTGDFNTGGSNKTKLVTAYRENALYIACCLERLGQLSTRQLREIGACEKTSSIINKNYYGWFEPVEKGVYRLTESGLEYIGKNGELARSLRHEIDRVLSEKPSEKRVKNPAK